MNYRNRLTMLIFLDSLIITATIFVAFWVVYPFSSTTYDDLILTITAIALLFFHHIFAMIYKLYNKVWAYASVGELMAIVKSVTFTVITAGVIQFFVNDFSVYKRALLVTWMMYIIVIGGSRFVWRIFRDRYISKNRKGLRTLIVGAGDAGAMIARQLNTEHNESNLMPVAFVDDDISKQYMEVYNLPVVGQVRDIPHTTERMEIEHIVIAIPSLKSDELKKIVEYCKETKVQVQMIPKIEDLMTGKVSVSSLRNVEVEDLLGRAPVELDINAIKDTLEGETVMVTGAGGSIGSELCRQLVPFAPKRIVLVGHGEFSIYTIDMELKQTYGKEIEIIPIIGDVQDKARMNEIVEIYQPKNIYHAAAHKHVPLMEHNPHETE